MSKPSAAARSMWRFACRCRSCAWRWTARALAPAKTFPNLRALGYVPQHDRMIVALRSDLGINSWAEWREKKPKLRITLGPNDGISFIGIAGHMLLEAHGLPRAALEKQGCELHRA